jgi:hypothetical protein
MRSDHVDASRAKLSRPPLLHEVGRYGYQHPDTRALAPGANLSLGSGLVPLREWVDSPWVSLLGLAFSYLCQPQFLDVSMFLRMVLGTLVACHGGHLTLGCGKAGGGERHDAGACS